MKKRNAKKTHKQGRELDTRQTKKVRGGMVADRRGAPAFADEYGLGKGRRDMLG